MFWAESSQCNSPLFSREVGQVEVLAGQVNFGGSLPRSAGNVLEPMLHLVCYQESLIRSWANFVCPFLYIFLAIAKQFFWSIHAWGRLKNLTVMAIFLKEKQFSENIWRGIVHLTSIYNSPSNILWIYASFKSDFQKNDRSRWYWSINGLKCWTAHMDQTFAHTYLSRVRLAKYPWRNYRPNKANTLKFNTSENIALSTRYLNRSQSISHQLQVYREGPRG